MRAPPRVAARPRVRRPSRISRPRASRVSLSLSLSRARAARPQRGVRVYILLYREVSEALQSKHRSAAMERRLRGLHANVSVLRHPSHFAAGQLYAAAFSSE